MYSKKINQLATNLNPQITDLIPVGDAITGQLKTATYGGVSGITGDGVISGGIVTWTGTGLVFNISACTYILNGVRYSSPLTTKTLAAADPTNPRIDVFAVNTSGQVEVIQGIPNANPVEPEGDTATTLGLTNVTIAAGATTPSNVTRDLIYDENVESWTKTVQVGGGTTYNLADTAFAYTGTKSILATMGAGFIFFRFSKAVAMDISNYKSLSFAIRLNTAWISNTTLSVRFYNTSNNTSSNLFQINSTNNVGFNRNLAGEWQLITIPFNNTNLKFTNNAFTEIRISTSNAAATYRLDTIQLNGGINNPIGGGTTPSNSFGFVNATTGTASATTATDTLNVVGTGLATTSATGKTLTIAVPSPIPSQTGNNGKYLTTDGSTLSWGTVSGGSMSIGGSITSATQGSVLFAGASGVLAQDNTNFFWDDTNNRLGIGTNTPTNKLVICDGSTIAASMQNAGADLMLFKNNDSPGYFAGTSSDTSTVRGLIAFYKSRGTLTSPTVVQADDYGGSITSGLYDGNNVQYTAGIFFIAESNASLQNAPQYIDFVTGLSSTNRTTKLRLFSGGNVLIQNGGTFTDAGYRLDVNGTTRFNGSSTFGTLGTGTGMFWDNTNNRLGIGISSPAYNLDVSGTTRLRGSSTLSNPIALFIENGQSYQATTFDAGSNTGRGVVVEGSSAAYYIGRAITSSTEFAMGISGATGNPIFVGSTTGSDLQLRTNNTSRIIIFNSTGNVGINQSTDVASAQLHITSTTKGFLPPRMTTTQKNAISSPAAGLVVYDTTTNKLCCYNGTTWNDLF